MSALAQGCRRPALGIRPIGLALITLLSLVVPFVVSSGYWLTVLTSLLINAILVMGLNFMIGYAGLLNLGYAAFAGMGAYGTTLAMQDWSVGFWLALVFGAALAAGSAVLIAVPTLQLSFVYLAIVTLAVGAIFTLLAFNLEGLTGGAIGIGGIPRPTLFGVTFNDTPSFYCFALGFALFLGFVALRFERSHVGRALRYVRADEVAAEASGIDTKRTKLLAYSIGAVYAAVGGALIAVQFQAIVPNGFDLSLTLVTLTMLVVGGPGSLGGAVLGAAAFTLIPEISRSLDDYRQLCYGVALTGMLLIRPHGLIPARSRMNVRAATADRASAPKEKIISRDDGTGAPLAEVRDVTKRFGGLVAVDAVSFTVARGEIVSVIGPNGAGKTTLIDVICGATRPTRGSVVFDGRELGSTRPSRRARAGLARTFQRIRVFSDLTVLENVVAGCHPIRPGGLVAATLGTRGYRNAEAEAIVRAMRALEAVGGDLVARAGEPAGNLAYGLQKRVELARALAIEPSLLILDEPAAGLNSAEKTAMMDLIVAIRDRGTGVILVEHDMPLVMGISDRVIVLDNGMRISEGAPAEVQNDDRVIDCYLGRDVDLV